MTEVFAIFTTLPGASPELFGLYSTEARAMADAAALREHLLGPEAPGEHLYAEVSVTYVPIRG
jgi:hypothetical protein